MTQAEGIVADFKTALDALGQGKVTVDALGKQLDKLLAQAPQHAVRLLEQLDAALESQTIGDADYAELKRRINQYRRAHAAETEQGEAGGDATVFAQEDNFATATTEIRGPAAGAAAGGDATQVLSDDERPAAARAGVDLDPSTPSVESFTPSSVPPSTGPTGTQWQTPMNSASSMAQELGPGSVIKERFKLLDVLGVGGMGKVYKGIDLLKQEARDKNPYVAIKLLNEDFKSHPEAFIALQRESSRQQKLAHPNIATVYDFDRIGGPGTPVFITMELMEGQPLNTYIKKVVRKQGGLPFPEAFNIVKQLGAALMYAHERRLVHSDFKPGNAFLCNDGTVKTLDFGIARAVKNPVTGEGDKTLFDPGKLGALTPAYASLEMLEGEEPDPRDDIYALGCVAYELLTGKHPFNKLPANTARDNGLVPAPIKGLNKKQNRALRRALAFRREDRTQTVAQFLEELEGKANWHKNPFVIAAAVLLIIGAIAFQPTRQYFHQKQLESIIAEINSGNPQVIVAKLEEIRTLPRADQATVTDQAKDSIQNYFATEIARHIDISGERFDFPKAEAILRQVQEFYPDSLFLQQQQNEVSFNRDQKLADLYNDYIAALNPEAVAQDPNAIDATKGILDIIRKRIDPKHPLLTDPRPANAYRLAAEQAMGRGEFQQALALIKSARQTAPDDARLIDLQNKVQTAIRVAELRSSLGAAELASLEDFRQQQTAIIELATLSSVQESPVLADLSGGLKKVIGAELSRILKEGSRGDAQRLADEYGHLLSALQLQQELTSIKLAHLTGDERAAAIQEIVAADRAVVDQRLAQPALEDSAWEEALLTAVRELASLEKESPGLGEELAAYRERIAGLYVERANVLLKANRFDAAEGFVRRGERFAPDVPALVGARDAVTRGRAEFERQLRIKDLKDEFDVQTKADRVAEARAVFDQLKAELPADDPFITTQGPAVLSRSYQRLAERSAENGDYATALRFAQAGLDLSPGDPVLRQRRDAYRVDVNITELTRVFREAVVFTDAEETDIRLKVDQVEQSAPTRYSEFRREAESLLAQRINTLAGTDRNAAGALAAAAFRIFPTSSVLEELSRTYQAQPWPNRALAEAALQTGALTQATRILQQASESEYAGHPDVLALQRTLETRIREANTSYESVLRAAQDAKKIADRTERRTALTAVRNQLEPILAIWSDNPDFNATKTDIDQAIAGTMIRQREQEIDVAAAASTTETKPWTPESSGYECTSSLAGHGDRSRAICFDLVNTGWRGPQMVVVPAGNGIAKPFAIGKYEISVGDWSKYCALSGKCKPVLDKERHDDPVTGITLQQAQDYVRWLSERTGKKYRLPTPAEWEHAATVGGKLTPESDAFKSIKGTFNCRVTLGDKVLKGTGIANVKSGMSNSWGLKNFVGNVQEWVLDGSGSPQARGGAYSDSISNCEISTTRPHSGGADDTTGFRVVLEDVG